VSLLFDGPEGRADVESGQSPTGGVPPPAAAPPSRSEIERKLSFKSAARPTASHNESPKKNKVSSYHGLYE
jgi:hypothetical protein